MVSRGGWMAPASLVPAEGARTHRIPAPPSADDGLVDGSTHAVHNCNYRGIALKQANVPHVQLIAFINNVGSSD